MPNSPVGMAGGFAELRAQLLSRTGVPGPARRTGTGPADRRLARRTGPGRRGQRRRGRAGRRRRLRPGRALAVLRPGPGAAALDGDPASYAGMLAERLWYPIWDSKIRLDHSVRSVGGARQIARDRPAGHARHAGPAAHRRGSRTGRHAAPPGAGRLAVATPRTAWRRCARPARSGPSAVRRTGLRHHPRPEGIPRRAARPGGDAGGRRVLGGRLPAPGPGGGPVRTAGRA